MTNNIIAAVALPPPLHGQSLVNNIIVCRLTQRTNIRVVNLSPRSFDRGLFYHLRRVVGVLTAIGVIILNSYRPRRLLYTVVDAGTGMIYTIILASVARLCGYRIVLHHHTSKYLLEYSCRFNRLARRAGGALHVVGSPWMARDLQTVYPFIECVFISSNVFHVPGPFKPKVRTARARPLRIGFLSNLTIDKGVERALSVAIRLKEAGIDVELLLAGPVVEEAAAAAIGAATSKLRSALHVLGPILGASKEEFFRSIDVFLFPTAYRYETHGIVVFEAMSSGVPPIVNECGYTTEFLAKCGAIVRKDEDYVTVAAQTIVDWIEKPEEYARQSVACVRQFAELSRESERQFNDLINKMVAE